MSMIDARAEPIEHGIAERRETASARLELSPLPRQVNALELYLQSGVGLVIFFEVRIARAHSSMNTVAGWSPVKAKWGVLAGSV